MGDRRRRNAATQGGSFGGSDESASCSQWPKLQARFQADVGQPAVAAQYLCGPTGTDRLGGILPDDRKWWDHWDRWWALLTRVSCSQADGAASCFQGPELQVNVGLLAAWAMGVDKEAISKQEAALMVLRTVTMPSQVAELLGHGARIGRCAPGDDLEPWADVAWAAEMADDGRIGGSMGDQRRQSEAEHGGSLRGTDGSVGCFLWPEL